MKIEEYFDRLIPKTKFYSMKREKEQSYITLENVIGPLPINKTALEIVDLCDGKRSVLEIFHCFKKLYPDVEEQRIFYDVIQCIRNYEMIGAIKIKVI